jgi:hypothetical protein
MSIYEYIYIDIRHINILKRNDNMTIIMLLVCPPEKNLLMSARKQPTSYPGSSFWLEARLENNTVSVAWFVHLKGTIYCSDNERGATKQHFTRRGEITLVKCLQIVQGRNVGKRA